jgi:hypothetical protein
MNAYIKKKSGPVAYEVNGRKVRRSRLHPSYYDVLDHVGRIVFTGTMADIRKALK